MSRTMDGTAVARIVASIAMRPVDTMRASRIGPRSERRPTPARAGEVTIRDKSRGAVPHSRVGALATVPGARSRLDHDPGRTLPMAHLWPVLFYVPAVLLLLATLSFITAMMDRRERRKAGR